MKHFDVLPECYVDTILVSKALSDSTCNHQKGCTNVAKVMSEKFHNSFAVGIIDKDKKDIDYFRNFRILATRNSLELSKHPEKHHYLIRLTPPLEKWLLQSLNNISVKPSDFGLPDELQALTKRTKTVISIEDKEIARLIMTLQEKGCKNVKQLELWLQYLINARYKADIEQLKSISS